HYDDSIFIISVEVINVRDNATGNPVAPYLAVRTTVVMEADTVTGGSATHEAGEKTDLIFVNIYYNDESDLGIIKRITGDQADMSETFSITTTLTIPQQVFDANPTFNPAVFLTGARAPVVVDTLATPPTTLVSPQPTITITGSAGNPIVSVTTELGHGHRLFFPQLISGTLFQAMEIQEDNFAGQAVVTGPGAGTFPTTPVVDADVIVPGATDRFVSDTGTSVITFTNDYREMILAGLLVGSMPMIFALLMATLLLAMMVASRSRKRIEQLPIAC
ncbi:MAG: hypothetical protein FWD93_03410, partial [Coriobacteriia bacterium]|nr:hypothetical protein [Coriobacteriia bacterium]